MRLIRPREHPHLIRKRTCCEDVPSISDLFFRRNLSFLFFFCKVLKLTCTWEHFLLFGVLFCGKSSKKVWKSRFPCTVKCICVEETWYDRLLIGCRGSASISGHEILKSEHILWEVCLKTFVESGIKPYYSTNKWLKIYTCFSIRAFSYSACTTSNSACFSSNSAWAFCRSTLAMASLLSCTTRLAWKRRQKWNHQRVTEIV